MPLPFYFFGTQKRNYEQHKTTVTPATVVNVIAAATKTTAAAAVYSYKHVRNPTTTIIGGKVTIFTVGKLLQ